MNLKSIKIVQHHRWLAKAYLHKKKYFTWEFQPLIFSRGIFFYFSLFSTLSPFLFHKHTHTHTHTYKHTHAHTHTHTHTCYTSHTHTHKHTQTHKNTHIHTRTNTHTHTQTHTSPFLSPSPFSHFNLLVP